MSSTSSYHNHRGSRRRRRTISSVMTTSCTNAARSDRKKNCRKKKRSHSVKTKQSPPFQHRKITTPIIPTQRAIHSSIISIDPDTPPAARRRSQREPSAMPTFPSLRNTHSISHTSKYEPPTLFKSLSTRSMSGVSWSSTTPLVRQVSSIRSMSYWRSIERGGGGGERGREEFTLNVLAKGLAKMKYKHVVVLSGAGISTTSGIPDFRTPGTGLYDNLKQYRVPEPSAIFDITYFSCNPKPFFTLAKELYPGAKYSPNTAHYFIRLLQDKGLLQRNYTQNIDGLERSSGIRSSKLVEAHGSFATASCTVCHAKYHPEDIKAIIIDDKIPYCKQKFCKGIVKPDIVFFGEDLPQKFYALRHSDLSQCDLLIIMGTSLEVEPFASLATLSRFDVPRVLINRELVGPFKRKRQTDLVLTGDLVEQITQLVRLVGWERDLIEISEHYKNGWSHNGHGHSTRSSSTGSPTTTCGSDGPLVTSNEEERDGRREVIRDKEVLVKELSRLSITKSQDGNDTS